MSSVWLRDAIASEPLRVSEPLDGDRSVDVCIVGGGFTGLWSAYELKLRNPSLDIAIVEKHVCGGGASGANAGYAIPLWIQLQFLERLCGLEEAIQLCRASEAVIDEIEALCRRETIPAELRRCGAIWGATCETQSGHWDPMIDALAKHQIHHFKRLSGAEVEALTGTRAHVAGVLDKSTALLHPGHLVRGLRRVVMDLGVKVFEHTPMVRLERSQKPRVHTPRGTVSAGKVVLGLYGWSLSIRELAPGAMVIFSDAVMSEPIGDRLETLGWRDGPGLMDSRIFVQAQRTTADGRLIWTKAGGALPFGARLEPHMDRTYRSETEMRRALAEVYPTLADVPIAGSWAGPIDRSKNGLPQFGALPTCPNIFYGYGYSGSGLVLSRLGGKILASLVTESNDEWSNSALVRAVQRDFPPEPIRYLGAQFVRAAIEKKDRWDHEGREVGGLTRFWLKFKPSSYKPT